MFPVKVKISGHISSLACKVKFRVVKSKRQLEVVLKIFTDDSYFLVLLLLAVITDPVHLWSSPFSESREHKRYFDDHFGPFFRPEMLIIKAPKGNTYTTEEINSYSSPYGASADFGPVMKKEILLEVISSSANKLNWTQLCFPSPMTHKHSSSPLGQQSSDGSELGIR